MNRAQGNKYTYTMLIPGCLLFLVFFIYPTLQGAYYSFRNWDGFTSNYIGLDNFKSIFTDPDMKITFKNTFIFAGLTTFFKIALGMLLALFVNQKLKTGHFLRVIFFLPAVLNNVAVGLMFQAIMHPTSGILNRGLSWLGLQIFTQDWLRNPRLGIYSLSAIEVWKWTGFTMIILLAGLQSIPKEYYEAAEIDGAGAWQRFKTITLPLVMPAVNSALIVCLIGGLRIFDIVYATTQGGPGSATEVLNSLIFKAYAASRYGEASAGSLILSLLVGLLSFLVYYFLRKREVEF